MKRALILQAGAHALANGGIADLDLTEIAAGVGLQPSSLRYYFKNREALAEAIYLQRLDEIEDGLAIAHAQSNLQDSIKMLFSIEIDHWANHTSSQAGRKPQLGEIRTLRKERRARVAGRFLEILEKANQLLAKHSVEIPAAMPYLPGQFLLENLFWIPAWIQQFHPWEYPKAVDDLAFLFCNGIARPDASFQLSVFEKGDFGPASAQLRPDAFLLTATKLVSERGYRGTSIDDIAARLGLTKGSFYHHNSEKDALVQKCFEQSYQRVAEMQRQANTEFARPLDRIASVLGSLVSIQMHQQAPIIRSSALPGLPQELRVAIIGGAAPLDRWFVAQLANAHSRAEATEVDPLIAAQFISIGANATYDLSRFYGYQPTEPNIAMVIDRLMHGFAN